MEKLKMQSPDKIDENLDKIAKLFPNVITESKDQEGNITKAIDFDLLKQSLSSVLVEDDAERYRLDWPGKKASLLKANSPINKTLRPCREESVNFDTTENLYLEGDNFQVLKILQESYLNKVKMIYIDPPYNTGKDFVYTDNFKVAKEDYEEEIGLYDEEGGKLFRNTDTNGRFHSDWLSMMYERLIVARDLLREDGVIFISIDDNEVHNLRKICDEVFGEENFVTDLIWEKKKKGTFLSNSITNVKEDILVYSKNCSSFNGLIGEINSDVETYPCINASNKRELRTIPKGIISKYKYPNYKLEKGSEISVTTMSLKLHSDLIIENNILAKDLIIEGNWRYNQERMTAYSLNQEIYITQDLYLRRKVTEPREKTLKDLLPRIGTNPKLKYKYFNTNNLFEDGWGSNEDGEEEIRLILESKGIMDYPKPSKLLKKLIASIRDKRSIILDFFSGSATTAHAVMQLNAEDGGNRKFIMVQLPEKTDEKSEAYKAGYKTISDIGKERIRRAGKQIMDDLRAERDKLAEKIFEDDKLKEVQDKLDNLDIGFRVYKTDSSNMKDVFYHPNDYEQMTVENLVSNTKEDRSPEDLLTQVILDLGLELNLPIEKQRIKKNDVYFVLHNSLVACFDDELDFEIVDEIAKVKPLKVVFKDSSFKDDKDRINLESRFKRLSPDTAIKVL